MQKILMAAFAAAMAIGLTATSAARGTLRIWKHRKVILKHVLPAILLAGAATPATAGGGIAYLSRTGSGSACNLPTPCATMSAAVTAAGAAGEVICLDKSNYGGPPGTISFSLTISCGDGLWEDPAGGISFAPPAGSAVSIEGLVLDGTGSSGSAISFFGQGELHLRRVRVGNNPGNGSHGMRFEPNGPATLHVIDSEFYTNGGAGIAINPTGSTRVSIVNTSFINNGLAGVLVQPSGGPVVTVAVSRSNFSGNGAGIQILGASGATTRTQITDSTIADNSGDGVLASTGTQVTAVMVANSLISGNGGNGVRSDGGSAVILNGDTVTNNGTALLATSGGVLFSYGNNAVNDNGSPGTAPTAVALR